MTARFSVYRAIEPGTGGKGQVGFAGFVEAPKFCHTVGFRLRSEEVRAEIVSTMRRRQIGRAVSDEGEEITA